ncbi:MAG: hypothetical protein AB7O97_06350 [Planctomycetota bacterium]
MRRCCAVLLLVLAGCGGAPLPEVDFEVALAATPATVEFGAPFALEVTATFRREFEPEPFAAEWLLPLELEPTGERRRDDGRRVQRVLAFRARAFASGEVAVGPIEWSARDPDGGAVVARSAPLLLRVASALGPDAAAAPEGPLELLPLPRTPVWPWALGGAVLLCAAALVASRARRRSAPPPVAAAPAPPPGPPSRERALQALAALERDLAAVNDRALCDAITAIVRDHAAAVLRRPTATRTSEELLELATPLVAAARTPLGACLSHCDRVKFAAGALDGGARDGVVAAARAFVQASAGPEVAA